MSLAHKQHSINRPISILPAKFDSSTVTHRASLAYLETFKRKVGFHQLLEQGIKLQNAMF